MADQITLDMRKRVFCEIEDELIDLSAATGVLHLAFSDMTTSGQEGDALAQSIFFTARGITAIVKRIEAKLCEEATPAAASSCACHEEGVQ